ncbi:hypothetical protein L1049_010635 [Liquidambar formosana]|uniref:Uncharacterized protein n=1 Tax=Liquidambar formosana TaxID=63359 RepID=A0AAP0N9P0_LIQFO
MGRENKDPTVIHSSIVLLQERFRQLHRVKKMREGRGLLKMLKEPQRFGHTINYDPTKLFFNPEVILPPRPPPQVSLSLWPNSHTKQDHNRGTETPLLTDLWPRDAPSMQASSNKLEGSESDVDTSLHL